MMCSNSSCRKCPAVNLHRLITRQAISHKPFVLRAAPCLGQENNGGDRQNDERKRHSADSCGSDLLDHSARNRLSKHRSHFAQTGHVATGNSVQYQISDCWHSPGGPFLDVYRQVISEEPSRRSGDGTEIVRRGCGRRTSRPFGFVNRIDKKYRTVWFLL